MNICQTLRCPFEESHSCTRYTTAYQCPVGLNQNGPGRNPEIISNGHNLFCEDNADIDINQLREILDKEVLNNLDSVLQALARSDRWEEIDCQG